MHLPTGQRAVSPLHLEGDGINDVGFPFSRRRNYRSFLRSHGLENRYLSLSIPQGPLRIQRRHKLVPKNIAKGSNLAV